MRAYNRRFAEIARRRRQRRMLGKTNRDQRCLIPGFTLKSTNPKMFVKGFVKWAKIELDELFASGNRETSSTDFAEKPSKAARQESASAANRMVDLN
jgi:hypothetical protein